MSRNDSITLADLESLGLVPNPDEPNQLMRASDLPSAPPGVPQLPSVDPRLYAALRSDIAKRGILIPLFFCAETGKCLDGQIRLEIAKELGIKKIPLVYVGYLSEEERRDLRIVLNGLRRQLSREQLAILIEWTLRKDPSVTDREVARNTGADHKTVAAARRRLRSVGEIPQHDKRKGRDGKLYQAHKPMVFASSTANANEARKALNALGESAPEGYSAIRKVRRLAKQEEREIELKQAGPSLPEHFDLRCCDFRDLDLPDEVADLMVLDPPWHTHKEIREPFAETVYRLLKPGGFALVYTGHKGLFEFGDLLRQAGLSYRWEITCVNDDGAGSIRNNGSVYTLSRLVTVYQKGGKFKTPSVFRDVLLTERRDKIYHEWQQPLSESVAFVTAFSTPGQTVIDLTACTFTVAEAVARVGGGRRFIGCEIEPRLVELGKRRVAEALSTWGVQESQGCDQGD
jgi:ParB-like chromosome segregation protein Spo0J